VPEEPHRHTRPTTPTGTSHAAPGTSGDGALRGLKVLLLFPTQTGVHAGQLLAEFGAQVAHVGRPRR
jgi:crotonobetainyl-CoA:carnitine CoA-transferase CaiB-like acyl-CoA transferase